MLWMQAETLPICTRQAPMQNVAPARGCSLPIARGMGSGVHAYTIPREIGVLDLCGDMNEPPHEAITPQLKPQQKG